jgi:predicted nucleic acid-binding Zn ribbon protein
LGKNYCSKECEKAGKKKGNGDFATRFVLIIMLALAIVLAFYSLLTKA